MKLLQAEAGVNDGKAGLQSAAGLFSKAGIFDKRSEAFNIKELNPYLLFDTRTSMLGELESPTLDLDPATPSTLDVITATRSGTATYTDVNGNIATAAADTVRVDYVDSVPMILVEPSATNLVDNSTSFQTTGSVTQESGIDAPDGTNTATRITNISGATGVDAVYSRANSVSPSLQINGSIYLRGEAGKVVRLYVKRYSGGTFISTPAESVLLTGSWQRYESPSFTLNSDNTNAAVALRNDGETTADSVDLWGGQIESGSVSTSVIPTSGSTVTRQADDLSITGSDFTDFYNQSEGTIYVESELQRETEVGFQPFLFDADNGDANRVLLYNETAGDVLGLVRAAGAGYQINLGTHPAVNTLSRTAFSYISNNLQGSKDGNSITPVTTAAIPTAISRLNVGSHYTKSEALYLNGRIKRLIYWPTHSDSL